jgi:hypothetical protein
MKDNRPLLTLLAIALAGFLVCSGFVAGCSFQGCEYKPERPVVVVPEVVQPDQVVYVYEKDDHAPPNEVMVMLDRLNRAGIQATDVDDDVVDGDGEVPDQYKAAIDAARLAGLPAFVTLSQGKFLDYADLAKLEELIAKSSGLGCPDTCYGPDGCDCHLKEGGCKCGDDRREEVEK